MYSLRMPSHEPVPEKHIIFLLVPNFSVVRVPTSMLVLGTLRSDFGTGEKLSLAGTAAEGAIEDRWSELVSCCLIDTQFQVQVIQ